MLYDQGLVFILINNIFTFIQVTTFPGENDQRYFENDQNIIVPLRKCSNYNALKRASHGTFPVYILSYQNILSSTTLIIT